MQQDSMSRWKQMLPIPAVTPLFYLSRTRQEG